MLFKREFHPSICQRMYALMVLCMLYFHFQSQENVDKKEGGVFIFRIPWTSSQCGVFRVSNFVSLQECVSAN